jgi:hypothetical protein
MRVQSQQVVPAAHNLELLQAVTGTVVVDVQVTTATIAADQ